MTKSPRTFACWLLAAFAAFGAWQLAACFVANAELKSDMRFLAVQLSFRSGLTPPPTEQGLRDSVVASARDHGIDLQPRQVTVDYTLTPDLLSISLAADYHAHVNLLVSSLPLHFTPSSSFSVVLTPK